MDKEEQQKEVNAIKASLNELKSLFTNANDSLQQLAQMQRNALKEVLDVDGASELIGISPDSINYYVQNNLIPHKKIGKHTRFSRAYLLRWIEEDMDLVLKNFRKK